MTKTCFVTQIQRLRTRFGDRAFDDEFVKLVSKEVHSLSDAEFTEVTNILIGTRDPWTPPLITDFREKRLQCEKNALSKTVGGVINLFERSAKPLAEILKNSGFEKCSRPMEAVSLEIYRMNKLGGKNESR